MKKSNLVRTIILAGSLLLQLSALCFHSRGAAGDVDLSFDPGFGVNGIVNTFALQPDRKVIIAGEFTTVKGLARANVARLNADGSGDISFDAGAGNHYRDNGYSVRSIALQPDGKLLVGYFFGVDRLNSDGSLDTNFIAAIDSLSDENGGYAIINAMALQSDGKVVIAGNFYTVNGSNVVIGIARLNSNGSLDTSFLPQPDAVGYIYSVVVQPDGKVLLGGQMSTLSGVQKGGVRLNSDGSLDSSFNPAPGHPPGASVGPVIYSLAVQSDGKVLIGGHFSTIKGTNRNGVARFNADGSLDSSFNPGIGTNANVHSLAVQPDGKVIIGGAFSTGNWANRYAIARLTASGNLDASFDPGTSANGSVSCVVVQPDGKVLMGGWFTAVNGTNRNRIARLNADGVLDGSFHPGRELEIPISTLVVQPDGKVLIGGPFTFINGTNRYGSARLNADGSLDNTFVSGTNFNPDLAAMIQNEDCPPDYQCYKSTLAAAVLVQSDGKVLIGGNFLTIACDPVYGECSYFYRYFLARFNADGSPDPSFEQAVGGGGTVIALAVQPDGKIVVGGYVRYGIARLNSNGSLDSSFNPGTGANGVRSIALQSDGKVLIGGSFTYVNGTNRNGIARLNANGSLDDSFNPGAGAYEVYSVKLQPGGKVLIGGGFTTVNGTNRNRIARLNGDGSLDSSFNPGTGADGIVRAIALQSDGNVLIGGDFTTVNGVLRPYVARLYGDSAAPSLNIAWSNAFVIISWPASAAGYSLQESTNVSLANSWSSVTQSTVTNAGQISVTIPTTAGRKFLRLKSQ